MGSLGVIWRSGGVLMAIDSRSVVEVLSPVSCQPALGTPAWVRGLFSYRGALIPMVDAATLLGIPREPDRMSNRVLVIGTGANGTSPGLRVGLWVESVLEIDHVDFAAAGGHPGFAAQGGRLLGSVVQTRWGQVQQIHPQALFSAEQALILSERSTGVRP